MRKRRRDEGREEMMQLCLDGDTKETGSRIAKAVWNRAKVLGHSFLLFGSKHPDFFLHVSSGFLKFFSSFSPPVRGL